VVYNPFDPGFRDDPYPQYAALRERDPVHCSPLGFWVLSRHEHVAAMLRNPATSNARLFDDPSREALLRAVGVWEVFDSSIIPSVARATLLAKDAPDHTRLRGLFSSVFTPAAVADLRPAIEALIDELLEPARHANSFDIVEVLARPLPALVICELLGVPASDREMLQRWSDAATALLEPTVFEADRLLEVDAALRGQAEYFHALVARRRKEPGDDLLSALVQANSEGEQLSDDELVMNAMFLFGAGHETTTNLIGSGVLSLLQAPDQLEDLRRDPTLLEPAIEEMLRYESPVQVTGRVLTSPVTLDGTSVPAGARVTMLLGAANRDPRRYADPDRFDIRRTDVRPLSFGGGIHFCLGAALARVEARAAIAALTAMPLALDDHHPPVWREGITLRGLTALPVRVEHATS
jgi:cytochrome P450